MTKTGMVNFWRTSYLASSFAFFVLGLCFLFKGDEAGFWGCSVISVIYATSLNILSVLTHNRR